MDNNEKKRVFSELPEDFPVVKENDTCPFWENDGDVGMMPMRECWYCKYSDFRKNDGGHIAQSLCNWPNITENIKE